MAPVPFAIQRPPNCSWRRKRWYSARQFFPPGMTARSSAPPLLPALLHGGQTARRSLDVGMINARFVKPLDAEPILRAIRETPVVVLLKKRR